MEEYSACSGETLRVTRTEKLLFSQIKDFEILGQIQALVLLATYVILYCFAAFE